MTTDPQIERATKGKKTHDKDASKNANSDAAHKGANKDSKADKKKAVDLQTPKPKKSGDEGNSANKASASTAATNSSGKASNQASSGKSKYKYGQKRNFYNPPGKVLRHLAQ